MSSNEDVEYTDAELADETKKWDTGMKLLMEITTGEQFLEIATALHKKPELLDNLNSFLK